ncbi:16S rRNA (cytosine(967)-C(5))-methyltransferase RsmB [Candidatus Rariloculus sp.]|uniref:16S rRNA (cytosine(967)-C(5))-methyltransferase RsmB n=1 Tax=Candidatus Rariloculus sp. TaxID=3101265 RepID=UPI003D135565
MSAERGAAGARVRAVAAKLNAAITRGGQTLDSVLTEPPGLPDRDLPLLRALLYGSIRWHHRLSWQLDRLLTRRLGRGDAELAALIRLGLFQLQWLRIPDHAAVSATVDATGLLGVRYSRGLVNAVLRRFRREERLLAAAMADVPEALWSHPHWLIDAIERDWKAHAERILAANNEQPPMWLRVNARRAAIDEYAARLAGCGLSAERHKGAPSALLLEEPVPTASLPGYADGFVSVQDAAAQLAAGFLDLRPGQRVLDACAAPGNKTAHMLETCPDLAEVVAIDRDAARLKVAEDNLARLGLAATLLNCDATETGAWWDGRPFDRILVDAPCSAIGVVRRHPDIKVLRRERDLDGVVPLQARLLERLWPLLAPGGRLLYATCTVLKRENHRQIDRFVSDTRDAELAGACPGGYRQLLPGEANMDGFYYACLVKHDTRQGSRASPPRH